ncbi:MAG TPA: tetratricopeptide repeat protein [Rhodocyclaceae bacterium]|nr:tetratricopeptide repeat protein [Rhodocyclaceae bacterium]
MARRLIRSASLLAATLLLGACGTLTPTSTEDAIEMQKNALLAYDGGDDAKAEALYVGLTRISPNDPEAWFRLGNLYARSNRADNAADAYRHALLLAPRDERAWYNLGIVRQRQAQAAFIQAQQLSRPGEEINTRSAQLVRQLAPLKDKPDDAPAGQ